MGRERLRAPFIIVALVALAGCNASYPFQPSTPTISALYVAYVFGLSAPVVGGPATPLDAYTINSDGVTEDVTTRATWQSSNAAVARVAPNVPNFTPVAPGVADISATYQGMVRTITVTVSDSDTAVPRLTLSRGGSGTPMRVIATMRLGPQQSQDVSGQATWTSSDPRIAVITVSGSTATVTTVSKGTVQITATFNGLSATVGYSVSQ